MKNKAAFQIFILFLVLSLQPLHGQVFDDQIVRVAIGRNEVFTTMRLQSFSGNWNLQFRPGKPPLHSVGTLLASATEPLATATEILTEGEDASIMLVPKGLVARLSTDKDLDRGYGQIFVSGGELLSIEIPGHQPMIFQGNIEIHYEGTSLLVINSISVRQFIIASVSRICFSNEPEVIKAMVVVIRSCLKHLKEHPPEGNRLYDLGDDHHSMPFEGCGYNRELVDILTTMMANQTLHYKGKPIMPRYQHTCGGRISSAKEIFSTDDEPYHPSHDDVCEGKGSENCFHSPSFHWIIELQKPEMLDFLSVAFAAGADRIVAAWEPEKVDASGRISKILLRGKKPKSVNGAEFLAKLQEHFGPNSIKSMKFNIENLRRSIVIRGMGQGDGVGLCLYGADGLARKNFKVNQILGFYYPGTEVK